MLLRQDQKMGNLQELGRERGPILTETSHPPRSKSPSIVDAFAIKITDRISILFIYKYVKTAICSFPRDIT